MHDYLRAKQTDVVVRKKWKLASPAVFNGRERIERRDVPVIPAERRTASFDPIEEGYPEAEARKESSRCLHCNVNTIFDTSICVACNGCVEVCPENLIKPVGLSRFAKDEEWQRQVSESFRVPLKDLGAMDVGQLDALGAVMTKDETACLRCAACASHCPTTALTMQTFEFYRECVSAPTRNPKLIYGDG
jgi:ferredoxin